MYARYRDFYRNRYGYYADGPDSGLLTKPRSKKRAPRALWRYNRPRPKFEVDYLDFIRDLVEDDELFKPSDDEDDDKPTDPGTAPAESGDKPKPEDNAEGNNGKPNKFKVTKVDFKIEENRKAHNTDQYEHEHLIIRRGQEFKMAVHLDRKFEKDLDVIKLQFSTGLTPQESKGTMFLIRIKKDLNDSEPSAGIDDVADDGSGSVINIRVAFPAMTVIGTYSLCIRLQNKEDGTNLKKHSKHRVEEALTILFNPWCKDDTVYIEDADQRKEYVMTEEGAIYIGSSDNVRPRPWSFGQFEKASLDAALHCLNSSTLPYEGYANPVQVSRTVSAMVNSNSGDNGILTGNWSGNYDDGTRPTAWNGSVDILEEFMETKSPVKYGQCWVFSGVTTTVCRALGIPTRSVTNFDSAHDTDQSMTIDYHSTSVPDMDVSYMNDSVWNFHVWNEGWFQRPDLPDGNDGWQAFDGTPQELSDSVMCCGPAPLKAIKEGNVHLGYDTKFVFGEVNGDRVYWEVYNALEERRVRRIIKDSVGSKISTKAVGKNEREDVTNQYKYTEGSDKERAVVKKVIQQSSRRKALEDFYNLEDAHDVDIEFKGSIDAQGDVNFNFRLKNEASENRNVTGRFHLMAKYYNGIEGDDVDDKTKTFDLKPGQEEKLDWVVKAADWINSIDEDATLSIYVTAKVKETSQFYIYEKGFEMNKPELDIKVSPSEVKIKDPVEVTVSFTNPLEVALTKAALTVEGAGFGRVKTINIPGEIPPKGTLSETMTLIPKMAGNREIIVSLNSRQLVNIFGSKGIVVKRLNEA